MRFRPLVILIIQMCSLQIGCQPALDREAENRRAEKSIAVVSGTELQTFVN